MRAGKDDCLYSSSLKLLKIHLHCCFNYGTREYAFFYQGHKKWTGK